MSRCPSHVVVHYSFDNTIRFKSHTIYCTMEEWSSTSSCGTSFSFFLFILFYCFIFSLPLLQLQKLWNASIRFRFSQLHFINISLLFDYLKNFFEWLNLQSSLEMWDMVSGHRTKIMKFREQTVKKKHVIQSRMGWRGSAGCTKKPRKISLIFDRTRTVTWNRNIFFTISM